VESFVPIFESCPIVLTRQNAVVAALACCLLLGSAPSLLAQNAMPCHTMGTREEIPPEKLSPPQKLTGIGNAHITITATPEAQMWFDQGLNLLHDFWDYESVRAFVQGTRVDPNCAMCYWGIYHAELFTHSNAKYYAKQALQRAVTLKKQVSEAERLYIEAAEKSEKDGKRNGGSRATKVYRKLVKKFPGDPQAQIFLAESVGDGYDDNGNPNAGQKEELAILQGVLKQDPENSAANHYWIHAVEASPHPEQALHSAEMLGRLAPTSGHMVHMPGHIFYRTGDYASAKESFAASIQADEHYMQAQQVPVDDDWNYVHNLMYAIANLLEAGQLEEATTLSTKLSKARGELENTLYPWSTRDAISRLEPRLPVALRAADWKSAAQFLQSSNPPDTLPNLQFLKRQLSSFVAGMQALDEHSVSQAESTSAAFDAELQKANAHFKEQQAKDKKQKNKNNSDAGPPKLPLMPDVYTKPLLSNLSILSLELRAAVLVEKKENGKAKELFAQATKEEKDLGYHEPPAYVRPAAEAEAAAFLAASDWSDARSAYKQALADRPRSGFPLYGIALATENSGNAAAARAAYADFLSAWKSADPDLPQLAHARDYVAAHGSAVAAK
jgi:tetratricopeptide (TPR) repeat protein